MNDINNAQIPLYEKSEQGELIKSKKIIEITNENVMESQVGFFSYKSTDLYYYILEDRGKLKIFKDKFYCGLCKKIRNGAGGNVSKHLEVHQKAKPNNVLSDKEINSRLIIWMIAHQIPFAAFEDDMFCDLFPNKLSYRGFKQEIHDTAVKIMKIIKSEIENSSYVSIGSDGWQTEGGRRFIGINVYYIINNEHATTRFLRLSNLELKDHTGINISNSIKENQFLIGYHNKVITYASDSANVNKTVANNLQVDFDPCFVHLLNICFNTSFGSDRMLLRTGILLNQLHSSSKFFEFLGAKRIELSLAPSNVTSFSPTRWLTLIDSLESLTKLKRIILEYFSFLKSNEIFNADDQKQEIYEEDIEEIEKILPILLKIKELYKEMLKFPKINFLSDLALILDEIFSLIQFSKLSHKYIRFTDSLCKFEDDYYY